MAKIDVIIPFYNAQKTAQKCIESVIHQTFKDINIICINDGSKDDTLKILQNLAKKYPTITVINQENEGPSGARNKGIAHSVLNSKSPYIMFLDSDDTFEPLICEKMYNAIKDNDYDIAICNVKTQNKKMQNYLKLNFEGEREVTNDVIKKTNVVVWNKIYKSSIIKENNLKFPMGVIYEDNTFFFMYMNFAKKIFFLNEFLYNYEITKNSITNAKNPKLKDYVNSAKHYFKFLTDGGHYKEKKELFWFYILRTIEFLKEKNTDDKTWQYFSDFLNNLEIPIFSECENLIINNIKNNIFPYKKEFKFNKFFRLKILRHKIELFIFEKKIFKYKNALNYKEISLLGKVLLQKHLKVTDN